MSRKKILLLIILTFVCGMSVVEMAPTFSQAKENSNVTIKLDNLTTTDMSQTQLRCFLQSKSGETQHKPFYRLWPSTVHEILDKQFAGRVHCDKDFLRKGQIRLHLSNITNDDLGNYWCELLKYDKDRKIWGLKASEKFVLDVTPTTDGDNSNVYLSTPKSGLGAPNGTTPPPQDRNASAVTIGLASVLGLASVFGLGLGPLVLALVSLALLKIQRGQRRRDEGQNADVLELQNVNPVVSLS